ncbi:anti-sigma factor [uncultured Amnibacterium sp.]|uniref:anti-sigma factor n=1 Tax=uncultured Amnibacterium sp. TaxID=1631851 RepID=UPI0035CBB0E2
MTHLDPELLALLGLGEDAPSAGDRLHLAGCADCRAEVARYARPVSLSRAGGGALDTPGPAVWAGIADELGLDPGLVDGPVAGGARPVVPLRRRRLGRRAAAVLAAVAAVVVVGGVAVGLLTARSQPQQLATATLDAFPGWAGSSGTAVLERLADGRRVVEVRTDVRPDGATDHEVWLMTTGAKRLVSLGMLTGTSGTFVVPAGLDLDRFRLVDVSDEPRDGNPAHSGDSIVRGALES